MVDSGRYAYGDMVNYAEAIEALRGHPRWWYYEYYGRTDEAVRAEAIELASLPDIDEHLQQASEAPVTRTCASC